MPSSMLSPGPWDDLKLPDQGLLELLTRLQSARLDDQRCTMPTVIASSQGVWPPSRHRLEEILRSSPPYPMVSLPPQGGFWCDPADKNSERVPSEPVAEAEETCRTYRLHFLQSEHFNFCGLDEVAGPVVLSVKYHSDSEDAGNQVRIILRLTSGSTHHLLPDTSSSVLNMAKALCPALTLANLQPVLCPSVADCITYFDE